MLDIYLAHQICPATPSDTFATGLVTIRGALIGRRLVLSSLPGRRQPPPWRATVGLPFADILPRPWRGKMESLIAEKPMVCAGAPPHQSVGLIRTWRNSTTPVR